jgi:hypothetical protein
MTEEKWVAATGCPLGAHLVRARNALELNLSCEAMVYLAPAPAAARTRAQQQREYLTVHRQNWLSNRVLSFDDIVEHCCYAWTTLIDQPWKIMSIACREHIVRRDVLGWSHLTVFG